MIRILITESYQRLRRAPAEVSRAAPRSLPAHGGPRVFFAAERTLLARIRTGPTVMAFDFLVARFGPFRRIVSRQLGADAHPPRLAAFSNATGVLLVLAGAVSVFLANREHRSFFRTLPAEDRSAVRLAHLHEAARDVSRRPPAGLPRPVGGPRP